LIYSFFSRLAAAAGVLLRGQPLIDGCLLEYRDGTHDSVTLRQRINCGTAPQRRCGGPESKCCPDEIVRG